ncbi:MAG: glycoside hydrolase family 99-like domain-containing protein [Burkholderiales bacterium]|nr:glycoside hydrolase family 99-like domain-containing protein [Burkholderiales bacterium]
MTEPQRLAAKLIAIYFPQFHAIAENDAWWGAGFTDWESVRNATPQYPGHAQPRVPLGGNYYDQSDVATLRWQVDLAKRYGVHGFCHYHYWFDGRQLLETPTNLMLANPGIDFPFCFSWANETWSRRWEGRDHEVLMQQTHPPTQDSWQRHFDYLIRAWQDPRAIHVDGKPVFVIYRPQNIPKLPDMLAFWRRLAQERGLPGLYVIHQKSYDLPDASMLQGFDAVFQFQPSEAVHSTAYRPRSIRQSPLFRLIQRLPERYQDWLRGLRTRLQKDLTLHDYASVWRAAVEQRPEPGLTTYPGAFVDWDNASRYKHRATVFQGATPALFGYWLGELLKSLPERNLPENFVWLNAWNEWAEAAYLEPDEHHGYEYLEALQWALSATSATAAKGN